MARSLTRSVPSRKRSSGPSRLAIRRRKPARCWGSKLPIVPPSKAITRGPCRDPLEVELEVADEAADRDVVVLVGDPLRRLAGDLLGDVDRDIGLEAAGVAHRVEQDPGLGRRARAELDQRARLAGGGEDLGGALLEDLALAAGRVVLGQLGDLLEELRAALVVEVARRELLEGLVSPARTSAAIPESGPPGRQVDVDGDLVCG